MSNEKIKQDLNYSKINFTTIKKMLNIEVSNKDRKENKIYKGSKDITIYNISSGKIQIILFFFVIVYLYSLISLIECKQRKIQSNDSIIHLKTNGTGYIEIIHDLFDIRPDIIKINGVIKNSGSFVNSGSNVNNITIIWIDQLTSTYGMFRFCDKIIEIDLSFFDSSNITSMAAMFYGCSSLTFLNITNFDTSKVTDMMEMFAECFSLISLDLSNFNTSIVENITFMFSGCSSLSYLDLSNFVSNTVFFLMMCF